MSEVIGLLEQLGANANLQSPQALVETIQQSDLSAELKQTLIEQPELLAKELECDAVKCFSIMPADDGDESEEQQGSEQEEAKIKAA